MKVQEGVNLHFIPTERFTTNTILIRFAAPMDEKRVAGRVLVANMLELSCQNYPTAQSLRRKLADLYGASLSTRVSKKGQAHLLDVTVSYLAPSYVEEERDLTEEVLAVLEQVLFHPLVDKKAFDKALFEMEKRNLLSYLEAEKEDNFYYADRQLDKLFFTDTLQSLSKFATVELVEKETAFSAYQAYQDMLKLDKIDIFILGTVNTCLFEKWCRDKTWNFRNPKLQFRYQQEVTSLVRELSERKHAQQSVLELGYTLQFVDTEVDRFSFVVLNSIWGGESHSKLFRELREKEGLAYTIGTELDIFSGLLRVYAGCERQHRLKVVKGIMRELGRIRRGKITDEELQLTKQQLVHAIRVSQDQPSVLVEQAYQETIFSEDYHCPEEWIVAIQAVTKKELIRVARQLHLQAVYFLEGVSE